MKTFLVEVLGYNNAVLCAAEYTDQTKAMVVAATTFKRSKRPVGAVQVVDPMGEVVYRLWCDGLTEER